MTETEADRKFIASMALLQKKYPPRQQARWPGLLALVITFVLATWFWWELLK